MSIKHGDWIRTPQIAMGIWKVSRTLNNFNEPRWSLSEPKRRLNRTLLFCHRIVNDSWKRSFSHQCCEITLAEPLNSQELQRLNDEILSEANLTNAFERYRSTVKPIDSITNLTMGGFSEESLMEFPRLCDQMLAARIGDGVTLDDVLLLLAEHGLDQNMHKYPQQATLQLTSPAHEIRSEELIYRSYRSLIR